MLSPDWPPMVMVALVTKVLVNRALLGKLVIDTQGPDRSVMLLLK